MRAAGRRRTRGGADAVSIVSRVSLAEVRHSLPPENFRRAAQNSPHFSALLPVTSSARADAVWGLDTSSHLDWLARLRLMVIIAALLWQTEPDLCLSAWRKHSVPPFLSCWSLRG